MEPVDKVWGIFSSFQFRPDVAGEQEVVISAMGLSTVMNVTVLEAIE